MTVRQLAAVPVPTPAWPGSIAPQPSVALASSDPPMATGSPGRRPSSEAWAEAVRRPASRARPVIGGSRPGSIPDPSQTSSLQLSPRMSSSELRDGVVGSVARHPVSRCST